MAFEPLKLEDLRKGLFVKLECSWWKHPFATNKFKVTTQKEIQIIKGISNLQLYFDPQLSDPAEPVDEPPPVKKPVVKIPDPPSITEEAVVEETKKEEVPSYLQGDRENRVAAFNKRRVHLKQTEKAFEHATRQTKAALRNMSSGDEGGFRSALQIVSKLTDSLSDDRTVMALLEIMQAEEDEEDPLIFHSMNVCVLSLLLGKELGLSQEELEWLGTGALAHDVGFLRIPRDLKLTTAGFARSGTNIKLHIHQGMAVANRIQDFPNPSLNIISQHHERLNGKGYPKGLSGDEISRLAKIVMVIDEYDDLCHNSERSVNLTPYEALSLMYRNATVQKTGEFDAELIVLLIQSLGVYPPGTLVELSDGSIGVVISINPEIRTRPQVMVYVEGVPNDEAVIADLAEDIDLTIEKSLRPQDLNTEIRKYLNSNRITKYFPSAKQSSSVRSTLVGAYPIMAK